MDNWPSRNSSIAITILAAAPTDCIIRISSNQIQNIAYFPHARDCVSQTFGNLSGIEEMFHAEHALIILTR
jgi:hypothetical protein